MSNKDDFNTMPWEDEAIKAVNDALDDAEYDNENQSIIIPATEEHAPDIECRNVDELQSALEIIYDEQWYANVPFESGSAIFESDSVGYVGELIADRNIEEFFVKKEIGVQPNILYEDESKKDRKVARILRIDLSTINDELIKFLSANPKYMREMNPRSFEELVAEMYRRKGYKIKLTKRTRDGGLDIYAIQKDTIGTVLTIIECKRYAQDNKVGVEIVRGLYGVVEEKRATKGIIATTSYFSKDAIKFYSGLKYRLGLTDYDGLIEMLSDLRRKVD